MSLSKPNIPHRRYTRSHTPIIVVWVIIGIAIVIGLWVGIRALVASRAGHITPVSGQLVAQTLMSKQSLVSRITELETTLASYDARFALADVMRQENELLKKELGRNPDDTKGILAHVLTPPKRSLYDTFIIDAGIRDGVSIGQSVYAFDAIAIGTITDVADTSATVTLYSAPGRESSGTAIGNTTAVTLVGRGGGEYEVRLPRDISFSVGEYITTQSTHTAILAQIEKIISDPRDPFQRLLAKAPTNLQALKWVIVR